MPFSKRLIIILIIVTVAPLLPLIDQIYMKLLPVLDFCLLYCASYTAMRSPLSCHLRSSATISVNVKLCSNCRKPVGSSVETHHTPAWRSRCCVSEGGAESSISSQTRRKTPSASANRGALSDPEVLPRQ